jgi:hypothetical protein
MRFIPWSDTDPIRVTYAPWEPVTCQGCGITWEPRQYRQHLAASLSCLGRLIALDMERRIAKSRRTS